MKSWQWKACFFIFIGCIVSIGCTPRPSKYPTSVENSEAALHTARTSNQQLHCRTIPNQVQNALLPGYPNPFSGTVQQSNRFDVQAKDVPARAFFLSLFKDSPKNIIIDPKVTGSITLDLHQVTLLETLAAVRDIYGYDYERTTYGYKIFPASLQTRLFNVNYLNIKRTGDSQTQLNTSEIASVINGGGGAGSPGGGTPNPTSAPIGGNNPGAPLSGNSSAGSIVQTHSENDYWKYLTEGIKAIIGTDGGRNVVVNAQSGIVMVRAFPSELREVGKFLENSERNINRQVIIEAKILEIQLEDEFQSGIDWTAFGNQFMQGTDKRVEPHPFTGIVSLPLSGFHGSFTTLIDLLKTQGNVQVLSSPRISTINNQNAVIKVGNDQFFVTSVSTNITPGGISNTTSQSVGLTPFFSGIALNVTPQIGNNGELTLYIHPAISLVENDPTVIDLGTSGTLVLPLAKSTLRESDSVVRAKNGEFIILGGLMSHHTGEKLAEAPLISRIPFFGTLFRDTSQLSQKFELVILLRPQITNYHVWQKSLKESECGMRCLDRGMHIGGSPEIFGTEAERFEE